MYRRVNNIKPIYNNVLFTLKLTHGDVRGTRWTRKITSGEYSEGQFMKPGVLSKDYAEPKKTNMLKRMVQATKDIWKILKSE